jgi:hypothetical protein
MRRGVILIRQAVNFRARTRAPDCGEHPRAARRRTGGRCGVITLTKNVLPPMLGLIYVAPILLGSCVQAAPNGDDIGSVENVDRIASQESAAFDRYDTEFLNCSHMYLGPAQEAGALGAQFVWRRGDDGKAEARAAVRWPATGSPMPGMGSGYGAGACASGFSLIRRRPRGGRRSSGRRAGRPHCGRRASPRALLHRGFGASADAIRRLTAG